MRHRPDEAVDRFPRQLRVGVERDDVADVAGGDRGATGCAQKRRIGRPAQQTIQLVQLPALALPPHPRLLPLVPDPPAVKNEEALAAARGRPMTAVQTVDRVARGGERLLVAGDAFLRRVGPVGQHGEAKIAVGVGEVVHLETLDLLVDLEPVAEQGRHDDHGPQRRGHAAAQLQSRQHARRDQRPDRAIDERDGQIGGGDQGQKPEHEQDRRAWPRASDREQRQRENDPGENRDGSQIAGRRGGDVCAKQPACRGCAERQRRLEPGAPVRDEVVPGLVSAGARRLRPLRAAGGLAGDLELGPPGAARQLFDRVPIGIAGREIHRAVRGAGLQHVVDEAHALEEGGPVERGHQAHAQDHVADGHVHGGLPLMLDPDDVVGSRALRGQALVQPHERRRHGGILFAQPLDELHREGGHQRGVPDPLQARHRRVGGSVVEPEDIVRQRVGFLARLAPANDGLGQTPEILDEHDPERDRHRPELADGERLHALVGAHESAERVGIQVAVGVRDERPGEPVDARVAFERTVGELGQLTIESARQIVPDLPQLLVHDVEVVDQPFRGRRDGSLLPDGPGDDAVGFAQDAAVVLHPRQEWAAPRRARDGLGGGQTLGVLLESLDAEQLRTDRLFGRRHHPRHAHPALDVRRNGVRPTYCSCRNRRTRASCSRLRASRKPGRRAGARWSCVRMRRSTVRSIRRSVASVEAFNSLPLHPCTTHRRVAERRRGSH